MLVMNKCFGEFIYGDSGDSERNPLDPHATHNPHSAAVAWNKRKTGDSEETEETGDSGGSAQNPHNPHATHNPHSVAVAWNKRKTGDSEETIE